MTAIPVEPTIVRVYVYQTTASLLMTNNFNNAIYKSFNIIQCIYLSLNNEIKCFKEACSRFWSTFIFLVFISLPYLSQTFSNDKLKFEGHSLGYKRDTVFAYILNAGNKNSTSRPKINATNARNCSKRNDIQKNQLKI